jgi:hypothetical protein
VARIPLCCCDVPATPIFDLEQPPPEPTRVWLPKVLGAFLGLAGTGLFILEDQGKLPDWHWPAWNALLLLPALYLVIAIHETGHLVAGALAGIETGGIAVGGFVFIKSGKNWIFRFERHISGGFFKPLTGTAGFRPSRYAWMIAGGPLASLALMALCGFASAQHGSGAWDWIGTLFWTAPVGIISLIPVSSTFSKSDGALLWMLTRHPERARSWMALVAIQTEEAKGLRPREWDPRLVEQMLAVRASVSGYPYCQLMAYYLRIDEGTEAVALEHLENALAKSARGGKAFRHALFLEAASASAGIRKQAIHARTWRERACKLRKPNSLDVVEAGIAMCEGRYQDAARHWEAARARVTKRKLDSGLIRVATEKWAEQEATCRERVLESGHTKRSKMLSAFDELVPRIPGPSDAGVELRGTEAAPAAVSDPDRRAE